MGYSINDAVSEILDNMYFLHSAFKNELINYSALARFIKPLVEKKVGESVGLDAVTMAIRRNSELFSKTSSNIYDRIKDYKLMLGEGMACVHFQRTNELYAQLAEFEHSINWAGGERMYTLQRTDEISVIVMENLLPKLLELDVIKRNPGLLMGREDNLALITAITPPSSYAVPGVFATVIDRVSALGINISLVFSSYTRLSLLLCEKDAPAAYEALVGLIHESKELAEQMKK